MNETQVVGALIEFYRRQGIDLHNVLDDPVFQKGLSLEGKIQALKAHAAEIVAGTHPGFSPGERQTLAMRALRLGAQGAFAGSAAGAALGAVAKGVHPAMPALLGGITGLTAGLASGVIEARQSMQQRKAVRGQLEQLAEDPSDANAVGALSIRGAYALQNPLRDEAYKTLRDFASSSVSPDKIDRTVRGHIDLVQAARAHNSAAPRGIGYTR